MNGDPPAEATEAAAQLEAALETCVVADRSDLGRVLATGPDLLNLLNRLSTKAVAGLAEGEGRTTVLTTNKGRIVARLFVHALGSDGVLLVCGRDEAPRVLEHFAKYTFAENTGAADATDSWCQVALVGPRAADALAAAELPAVEPGRSARAEIDGHAVHVLGEDGDTTGGFSVAGPAGARDAVLERLASAAGSAGGRPADNLALEARRVLLGIPASGHELTEGHNPLEAGLWDAVDFDKGCYVGQEVVARLNTYDKVARAIRGLVLASGAEVPAQGTPLFAGERRVGEITSALLPPGRRAPVALGYVKRGHAAPDTTLSLGTPEGAVVVVRDVPFEKAR
jgi:folate-binding protein YgfZ